MRNNRKLNNSERAPVLADTKKAPALLQSLPVAVAVASGPETQPVSQQNSCFQQGGYTNIQISEELCYFFLLPYLCFFSVNG